MCSFVRTDRDVHSRNNRTSKFLPPSPVSATFGRWYAKYIDYRLVVASRALWGRSRRRHWPWVHQARRIYSFNIASRRRAARTVQRNDQIPRVESSSAIQLRVNWLCAMWLCAEQSQVARIILRQGGGGETGGEGETACGWTLNLAMGGGLAECSVYGPLRWFGGGRDKHHCCVTVRVPNIQNVPEWC